MRGYNAAADATLGRGSQALTEWIKDFECRAPSRSRAPGGPGVILRLAVEGWAFANQNRLTAPYLTLH